VDDLEEKSKRCCRRLGGHILVGGRKDLRVGFIRERMGAQRSTEGGKEVAAFRGGSLKGGAPGTKNYFSPTEEKPAASAK